MFVEIEYKTDKLLEIINSTIPITYEVEINNINLDSNTSPQLDTKQTFEIELILNSNLILLNENKIDNIIPYIIDSKTDKKIEYEIELVINDLSDNKSDKKYVNNVINTILNTYSRIELSNKNEDSNIIRKWYTKDKIKYKQLINLKNNAWVNISLNDILINNNYNLLELFNKIYINQAYILNNNKYYNIISDTTFRNQYIQNLRQISESINKNDNINYKLQNLSDSCWIKKNAPKITCLIIGINYIGTSDQLNGAVNDANNMETFLKKNYGDQIKIIKLIEDSTFNKLNVNSIPNTVNIKKNIETILNENNNIIFYYAGHIFKDSANTQNKEEEDLKNEYIKTLDGNISDDWFNINFIKKIKKNLKCRILIDSCYSCGYNDLKYVYENKINIKSNNMITDTDLAEIITITSSNEYQLSYEKNNQGIFTTELINKLENIGNFNITESFDYFKNSRISSSFLFSNESILLL